jgi:hypothetical protein
MALTIASMLRLPQTALRRLIPLVTLTLVSVSGAVLVSVWCLSPAQQALTNAEQAYRTAKQAQMTLQASRTQQSRARAAQRQLETVRQALPTQNEFTPLAMALTELGKSEHVLIPGMGYDIKKPEGGLPAKATIAFRASGDYGAVYRFIHRLESVDPYIVIESLDVSGEQKKDSSARVVVNMKVSTYLRQSEGAGSS